MSAWRWGCVNCGSVGLMFQVRTPTVRCGWCKHKSDKVKDRNTRYGGAY